MRARATSANEEAAAAPEPSLLPGTPCGGRAGPRTPPRPTPRVRRAKSLTNPICGWGSVEGGSAAAAHGRFSALQTLTQGGD